MSKNINTKALAGTFIANLSIQACNILTGICAARILHPAGRGALAAIILWPTIMESLGSLGVDWVLARKAAARRGDPDLEWNAVVLGLVMGLFTVVLGYFLVPHLLPKDKSYLITLTRIYLLYIPLNYIATNLLSLDKGRLLWSRFNWVRISYTLPYTMFIVFFWVSGVNQVKWFILALMLSTLFTTIIRVLLQWQKILRGRSHLKDALDTVRSAYPFFAGLLGSMLSQQIDKVLVVALLPIEMVGYYAAALTFASAHTSLRSALGVTSFAALANEPDRGRQGHTLTRIFRQSTWLLLPAGGGVAGLAFFLIVPLFGPAFAPAIMPAVILALATSLMGLTDTLNEGMWGMGITYPGIAANIIGGGLTALPAWFLIPRFGLLGLAGALVFGSSVRLLFLILAACRLLRLRPVYFWGFTLTEFNNFCRHIISIIPNYKRSCVS
ncbi:MAG: lipopolysaccharide biosynthesis protein [Desulfobaccales bacterium]